MSERKSFKVIMIGDGGVGKTALVTRQCKGLFDENSTPTIGTAFSKTVISYQGTHVELQLWDTAGQEQYASLVPLYTRGAAVCILVASITSEDSFKNLAKWKERVESNGAKPNYVFAINKYDLEDKAALNSDELQEYEDMFESTYYVSAKNNSGVSSLFYEVARIALEHSDEVEQRQLHEAAKKNSCC